MRCPPGRVAGWERQPITPWSAAEARAFLDAARNDPLHPVFRLGPVKTNAGRRDLPLLPIASDALLTRRQAQDADRAELGRAWQDTGLIFTTKTGWPIEPRNLVRSFHRICAASDLRDIKVHHLRHTTATLLKNLGVPARDAQIILGHSRLAVTLEIYTHEDRQAQRGALGRLSDVLRHDGSKIE